MFLLNNVQILDLMNDSNQSTLRIKHCDPNKLQHTSYYFRLGPFYATRAGESWSTLSEKNRVLELKSGAYYRVQSLESFFLSDKILGIFGPSSDIIKLGLRLVHGPFIDPLYDAPLELGLHNPLQDTIHLSFRDTLGKICFFNIADTYPVRKIHKSSFANKLDYRSKLREQGVPDWMDSDAALDLLRKRQDDEEEE